MQVFPIISPSTGSFFMEANSKSNIPSFDSVITSNWVFGAKSVFSNISSFLLASSTIAPCALIILALIISPLVKSE